MSTAAAAAKEKHAVVIIGGGVSGLYTALKLIASGIEDVRVYEGRPMLGGRVRTTRDGGNPRFNDFAWRVGAANTRMLALAEELGIELVEQFTPPAGAPHDGAAQEARPKRAPLSVFAQHCLESTAAADRADRESGYAGRTAQITFPGEAHAAKNFFVAKGMDEYVKQIAARLPEGVVHTGHLCMDVVKNSSSSSAEGEGAGYRVELRGKDGPLVVEATTVVLAAPPVSLRQFSVARDGLNPALFAVHQRRLGHVYARATPADNVPDSSTTESRIYRSVPDSILQQVISGDYGGSTFQAGYACDRFERVWRELQFQGSEVMRQEVASQLDKIADTVLPELKGVHIEEVSLRISFVHRWQIEAHVSGKTKVELSKQAVYPNAADLPGLHLVGEAFSAHQGWTEGALQTAEDCAAIIVAAAKGDAAATAAATSPFSRPVAVAAPAEGDSTSTEGDAAAAAPKRMFYGGLVLDVGDWPDQHPGGQGPIKYFTGKDVRATFDAFHNGWPNALATVFGLQAGVREAASAATE